MGEIHHLIERHGRVAARSMVEAGRACVVDVAARILEEDSRDIGITYSGFCLTALPHKKLRDNQPWMRQNGRLSLVIEPGHSLRRAAHTLERVGVPYGPKARLILLYLQTRALQDNSREVEIGRSMHDWLKRMDIAICGKSYTLVRDQAERLSRCRLTFYYDDGVREGFENDHIIKGGLRFRDDERQESLWKETVMLGEAFFDALRKHPVPIWEPAVRALSAHSMAIDTYVWLAYRLHVLQKPTPVSWAALYGQFGAGYKLLRQFRFEFRKSLDLALAVYPDAVVTVDDVGVTLHPSPPPIPERLIGRSYG